MAKQGKRVVGVDVYRGRWVAVQLVAGGFDRADCDASLAVLLGRFEAAEVVGVDMPIGLPRKGVRPCDPAAGVFVGARRQSVFEAPPAAALRADRHAEATRIAVELSGRGISIQAFGLKARINEVAKVDRIDDRLIEVHPEASFCAMNADRPLEFSKRSWGGQNERRRLLADHGIELPERLGDADVVPVDDVLDAASAAWSADRYARKQALSCLKGVSGIRR